MKKLGLFLIYVYEEVWFLSYFYNCLKSSLFFFTKKFSGERLVSFFTRKLFSIKIGFFSMSSEEIFVFSILSFLWFFIFFSNFKTLGLGGGEILLINSGFLSFYSALLVFINSFLNGRSSVCSLVVFNLTTNLGEYTFPEVLGFLIKYL